LVVRGKRPRSYLETLAGLFRSVSDANVAMSSEYRLYLDQTVLSDIDVPIKWNGDAN